MMGGARGKALPVSSPPPQERDRPYRFARIVAHDLKAPVNTILLMADRLLDREGAALSARGREELSRITEIASHAENMVAELLQLVRIASIDERPALVDLDALVASSLQDLEARIAAKRARLRVSTLPRVWGQPGKLGRVVANLLENAVAYVPAGRGVITIAALRTAASRGFTVEDNGIGIPAQYHERLFDPFWRVPEPERLVDGEPAAGVGLGLTIVKEIVAAHGGTVTLESAPGVGSRFAVRLPARGRRR
jgi:signal transduction histidine kinase